MENTVEFSRSLKAGFHWRRSRSPSSKRGCQSFRLQVDSPTSRSFRLHDQVVSPTRSESIRLHSSRFAYTYKSKCFVKMDEHHCLQLPTVTRVLGARASAFGAKTLQWTMITEPLKSPRYKSDILQPSQKCSKMYGTGPRYNEILTYKEPR